MSDNELSIEALRESMIDQFKKMDTVINVLNVKINDLNNKCSEITVVSGLLREFISKYGSGDIESLKAPKSKSTGKRKVKDESNNITSLEHNNEESSVSKYNIFVDLVKGDTEFAPNLAIEWSNVDKTIPEDPKKIDYVTFYSNFISSNVEIDKVPKSLRAIRKQIWDEAKSQKKSSKGDKTSKKE